MEARRTDIDALGLDALFGYRLLKGFNNRRLASGFLGAKVYPVYISNGRPGLMGGAEGNAWISQVAGMSQALGTPARVENGTMSIP